MAGLEKEMRAQLDFIVRRFQEAMTKTEKLDKEVKNSYEIVSNFSSKLSSIESLLIVFQGSLSNIRDEHIKLSVNEDAHNAINISSFNNTLEIIHMTMNIFDKSL